MPKRNYTETHTKAFRSDKQYPKRTRITIEKDYGRTKQVDVLTSPDMQRERRNIPDKPNGMWKNVIEREGLKVKERVGEGWFAVYAHDRYVGKFSTLELYSFGIELLKQIGAFSLVTDHIKKGRRYYRQVLVSYNALERKRRIK